MQRFILAMTLVALSSATFAQTNPGPAASGPAQPPMSGMSGSHRAAPPGAMAGQTAPENCGTPDEPKACPPLPRHPLPYYPPNKQ